ncbi:MAG: hydrogenase maturation peptidase HycI [Candidatus Bathyarchaeota archaeon]|nr:hydrogenase maturation peptidase HycI [Candidatus Bathyarchaeota archaeon]
MFELKLRSDLKTWLEGCSKLVILGVGNVLRGDDALGPEFISRLMGKLPKKVKLIDGGVMPENFIGHIRRFKPSHVLLIDAADFGGKPGEIRLIPPEQISSVALSTHSIPLHILAELIGRYVGAKVMLLGVEPKSLNLGEDVSPEVKKSIELGSRILLEILETIDSPKGNEKLP